MLYAAFSKSRLCVQRGGSVGVHGLLGGDGHQWGDQATNTEIDMAKIGFAIGKYGKMVK